MTFLSLPFSPREIVTLLLSLFAPKLEILSSAYTYIKYVEKPQEKHRSLCSVLTTVSSLTATISIGGRQFI